MKLEIITHLLSSLLDHTARKTIFFSQTSWKDGLSKKNAAGIWSFWHYRERRYFFFPKIWSYPLYGKWKMIFLIKIHGSIFSSNVLKRWSFEKGLPETWSFLYHLEGCYFFGNIFFPWTENGRWSFSRNTWKYDIFCVHLQVLQTWRYTPLPKRIKDDLIP